MLILPISIDTEIVPTDLCERESPTSACFWPFGRRFSSQAPLPVMSRITLKESHVLQLPKLQSTEFWRLSFITTIVQHLEQLLEHVARLMGVASGMDVEDLLEGRLAAMLDFVMRLLTDEILDSVVYRYVLN